MNRLKVFSFCWKGWVRYGSTVAGRRRLQLDQVKSTNDDHVFAWLVDQLWNVRVRCVKCGSKTIRTKFLSLCLSSAIFTHLVMQYYSNFFAVSTEALMHFLQWVITAPWNVCKLFYKYLFRNMTFFHDSYGYAYSLLPMLLTVEFDWLWTSLVVTVRSITILSLLLVLVSFETSCNLSHYLTNEFMLLKLKSVSFWDCWSKTLLILVLQT